MLYKQLSEKRKGFHKAENRTEIKILTFCERFYLYALAKTFETVQSPIFLLQYFSYPWSLFMLFLRRVLLYYSKYQLFLTSLSIDKLLLSCSSVSAVILPKNTFHVSSCVTALSFSPCRTGNHFSAICRSSRSFVPLCLFQKYESLNTLPPNKWVICSRSSD